MSLESSGVKIGGFDTEMADIGIGTTSTDASNGLDYRCSGLCDLRARVLERKNVAVPIGVEMVPRVSVKCRYVRLTHSSNLTIIRMWSEGVLAIDLPVQYVKSFCA